MGALRGSGLASSQSGCVRDYRELTWRGSRHRDGTHCPTDGIMRVEKTLAVAHVPQTVVFATKPRLAVGVVAEAIAASSPFAWVAAISCC